MLVVGGDLDDVELAAHLFSLLEKYDAFLVQDRCLSVDYGSGFEEFPACEAIIIQVSRTRGGHF